MFVTVAGFLVNYKSASAQLGTLHNFPTIRRVVRFISPTTNCRWSNWNIETDLNNFIAISYQSAFLTKLLVL